jgi:hypothetical protein
VTGIEPTISVVIGTDCIGSCKSNYHTITATVPVAPRKIREYREIEKKTEKQKKKKGGCLTSLKRILYRNPKNVVCPH